MNEETTKMWHSLAFWCCLHMALICTVEGVTMSISPPEVVLHYPGTGQPVKTTFLCDGVSGTDIASVISLQIKRSTGRETQGETIVIAAITPDKGATIPQVSETNDIQNRAKDTVTGTVDKVEFSRSNLQIVIDTLAIECRDVGQYTCQFYYMTAGLAVQNSESSMNLTVRALPSDVTLSARRFGRIEQGTITNPLIMKEGEEIEFTCSGNIGSDTNLNFEWWITGNMGLIKFRPDLQPNAVETRGQVTPLAEQCTNSRVTTMSYNISASDRNRGSLVFKCFAPVSPPGIGGSYQLNSTAFYIDIEGGGTNGGGNPGPVATAGDSNAGVIAGAVCGAIAFIVIVVLLIYFLWYRRRGGGDTYKTREETGGSNPNLAPTAADLYAKPNNDRNRNQPDSSDMNTPPKPKPRAKKGKELHYAELDIASNVPMVPPRPPHDRVEYAEVKFNKNSDYEHPV